jgi:hypothetical protein
MTTMPWVRLYGGELDGWREEVAWTDSPDIFYVVPLADIVDIDSIKNEKARAAAYKAYARLAYSFKSVMATESGVEFCYHRCLPDPKTGIVPEDRVSNPL